ncbi:MAG TPA: succinate dehydrogenase, cytochrome b556 subunit [Thermomicrobiales bacterium]|jgi:succinate dehydrogenase cytochrome b556 subunit|nr:succinate dehydrogenase, cytochrome b556 subunit [Thermomicrobiales bacterium]
MASIGLDRIRGAGAGALIPGADRLSWYFLRVSGILLIGFALGHLFITHYLNVPSETTFAWVANRWENPLWRAFDWVLLLSSLWHGLVGMRYSITDWVPKANWRVAAFSLVFVVGILWTALGTTTIFAFDAATVADNNGPLGDEIWVSDLIGWSLFAVATAIYLGTAALIWFILSNLRRGNVPIYNGDVGQYAWALHRATGIGTVFFLLVHVLSIMLIGFGQEVYDHSVAFYSIPYLIPMEVALVGAVVYHSLNGLRIMAIDFWGPGVRRQRQMWYAAMIGTILLTAPAGIIIVAHELF